MVIALLLACVSPLRAGAGIVYLDRSMTSSGSPSGFSEFGENSPTRLGNSLALEFGRPRIAPAVEPSDAVTVTSGLTTVPLPVGAFFVFFPELAALPVACASP